VLLAAAFAIPTPLGQNALRPGVLLGPSLLVCSPAAARRAGCSSRRSGCSSTCSGCRRCARSPRPAAIPSTTATFYAPLLDRIDPLARPGDRVEVPLTRNHWEAAYVAEHVPLARGWHRQLDRKANPLFYGDRPLNAATYLAWLQAEAVRWVALPDAPLDPTAEREVALLRRGVPGLRLFGARRTGTSGRCPTRAPWTAPRGMIESDPEGFELLATGPGHGVRPPALDAVLT
jgi:hypothetical protein